MRNGLLFAAVLLGCGGPTPGADAGGDAASDAASDAVLSPSCTSFVGAAPLPYGAPCTASSQCAPFMSSAPFCAVFGATGGREAMGGELGVCTSDLYCNVSASQQATRCAGDRAIFCTMACPRGTDCHDTGNGYGECRPVACTR